MEGTGGAPEERTEAGGRYGEQNPHALQKRYLDGLRKYKKQGVKVLIDGEERSEKEWDRLFGVAEDGGFYMADFISAPEGGVREIRFDKIYVQEFYD